MSKEQSVLKISALGLPYHSITLLTFLADFTIYTWNYGLYRTPFKFNVQIIVIEKHDTLPRGSSKFDMIQPLQMHDSKTGDPPPLLRPTHLLNRCLYLLISPLMHLSSGQEKGLTFALSEDSSELSDSLGLVVVTWFYFRGIFAVLANVSPHVKLHERTKNWCKLKIFYWPQSQATTPFLRIEVILTRSC